MSDQASTSGALHADFGFSLYVGVTSHPCLNTIGISYSTEKL